MQKNRRLFSELQREEEKFKKISVFLAQFYLIFLTKF